ncbi:SH3 domain-containing protein [Streptococcus infantis]|uniref:SH3 domain-containing protein n=1 Tax=Streptococcus infantis TaxID=68892 RepID=UPI001CBDFD77|nr:SH3 domain-containing protein [Streptococcus infantis]MBZ2120508.1 SH3 domain-containing protein [Streptococcus infantis]MBZ2122327.1 SH3 domain-containing protein [Streptococcus infantis]MBZ2126129.1 SH3 domain-containing protein [Streptococcus infantis]
MTYSKKGTFLKRTTVGTASLLLAGAFLFGGGAVHANQANNGSLAQGDDYPYYYKNGSQEIDKWRMYSRQCTSFAAFRLSSVNGFELPAAYGNANQWGYRAKREGYRVDQHPAIGSIAWDASGQYGHVAWVSNVLGDMIEIEEYNYGIREKYNRRIVKASSMTGFIHFKDVGQASTGNHQATLVSSGTHVFTEKAAIMNQPSQAAEIIDYYYPGESVHYDQTLEKDGYKWISYLSRTGNRRYVQIAKTATAKNGWEKQGTIWYYYENDKVALGWKKINGSWYYFQTSGAMRTGWLKDGSKWYYLKSSGEMQTGWLKDKGIWYYLESSGAMKASQWFQVSGKYYYVNASGELAVDTTIDGFQVDSNGARVEESPQ